MGINVLYKFTYKKNMITIPIKCGKYFENL